MAKVAAPLPKLDGSTDRRPLDIPAPPGHREEVVEKALKRLEEELADEVERAESAINVHGITIEASRLRDRLHESAKTHIQQLMLSTPGVTEALFCEAIEKALDEPGQLNSDEFAEKVGDVLNDRITNALTTVFGDIENTIGSAIYLGLKAGLETRDEGSDVGNETDGASPPPTRNVSPNAASLEGKSGVAAGDEEPPVATQPGGRAQRNPSKGKEPEGER